MLNAIISFITKLIPKTKLGTILSILLAKASSTLVSDILNPENQRIAYYYVKLLAQDKTLTNHEKRERFNRQMLAWAKAEGKKIAESVINCLRELAVNALKSEIKEVENTK